MIRTYTKVLILTLGVISVGLPVRAADSDQLTRFKAVFVYNFMTYVYWPESEQFDVVKIGILGDSPLEKPLREIAEKKSTEERKLRVDVGEDIEDLGLCHVLFISSEQIGKLEEIQKRLGDRSVLTVADMPGLATRGVAINFVLVKGKLKFEINQQALKRAGLQASAQLLKLAILVEEDGKATP